MSDALNFFADYLLNSLWQVPLLFAAAWLLSRAMRRLGPLAEHRVWVGALLLEAVLPACSAPGLGAAIGRAWQHWLAGETHAGGAVTVALGAARPLGSADLNRNALHVALLLYGLATTYLTLRFLWQWWRVRVMASPLQRVRLQGADAAFFASCCEQWNLHNVELACGPGVRSPMTFGLRRALLLLPQDFAQQMSGPRLRATLGHELAHIRRNDYAKHLLYRALSLPVAYHPLLWSTLARAVETREQVCDATAAEVLGDRKQFARSLLELASLLIDSEPTQSHAIGMFDANRFERRILMLHGKEVKASRPLRVGTVALSAVAALVTCTSAMALRLHVDTPVAVAISAEGPVHVQPGVMAGQVINKTTPKYPEDAKKAKISGAVVLNAVISKEGTVENLQVVSGPQELRASALDAVKQWTYKPYLLNGEPTEVETTITVTYSFSE